MLRKTKGIVAVALCLLLFFLCGCGNEATLIFPENLYAGYNVSTTDSGNYNEVRLFLDNTTSMYGYVMEGTNQKSKYVDIISCVLDFMDKYNSESYYYMNDEGSATKWVTKTEDDFNYKAKDFYCAKNPISNPYLTEYVNGDTGLNIFITDLAEGAAANKSLAEAINKNVITGEDRSALLYCFVADYSGKNYVDDAAVIADETGSNSQVSTQLTINNKPFYMLVAGPTSEIVAFRDGINNDLQGKNYTLGTDFYCESFLSGRGLQTEAATLRTSEFEVNEESLSADKFKKYYTRENTNLNYNIEIIDQDEVFTDVHQNLPGIFAKASKLLGNDISGDEQDNMKMSFLVDLPNGSDNTAVQNANYTVSLVGAYYAGEETETSVEVTSEDGEKTNEIGYEFLKMDDDRFFDVFQKDNGEKISVKYAFVTENQTINKLTDEQVISDLGDNYVASDNQINIEVADSGSLYVTLDFNGGTYLKNNFDYIILQFEVTGKVDVNSVVPAWISNYDYDLVVKNKGTADINICAHDLKYIFDYLNGTMANQTSQSEYENYLETTICSFPVLIDLRGLK